MTGAKRALKVFLCHAHADRDSVRALYTRLTDDGVDAWLDKEKLLPGQDWELEIRKAVREADVVVVCLSRQFNQAGFRQKEVKLALDTAMEQPEGEIFIIPARLEECDTLESLRKWHWVDLYETDGYEMLMRALRRRAEIIGAMLKAVTIKPAPKLSITNPASNNKKRMYEEYQPRRRWIIQIVFSLIGLAILIVALLLSSSLNEKWFSPMSVPTETMTITLTASENASVQESITATPVILATQTINSILTSTETHIPTSTLTPLQTEITDAKGVSMMLVPEGEFIMGSEVGFVDASPVHQVFLNAYYIDKYEVTNLLYKICVEKGVCVAPTDTGRYSNSNYLQHPVNYVNWSMANIYCVWRGTKLPTEAQWEKAARGVDSRTYPWGEEASCNRANYLDCVGDTTQVGIYADGKSPYGIYDLTGNVSEWVADWYSETYYQISLPSNPTGPASGQYIVRRGGFWGDPEYLAYAYHRNLASPNISNSFIGFRCAKDVP